MKIRFKGIIYTIYELKKVLNEKEFNIFVNQYNKFQDDLAEHVRTSEKYQGISIPSGGSVL